mmetsp:Transcript_6231/g.18192  ORF Transcript_6231/g.18192 Transcript_6231/m.18192 type:complete len:115 (-) Transcript_6231:38-382(-)
MPDPAEETWMELGFIDGERLQQLAKSFPHSRFIGAEVFTEGAGRILCHIEEAVQKGKSKLRADWHYASEAEGPNGGSDVDGDDAGKEDPIFTLSLVYPCDASNPPPWIPPLRLE